RSRNSLDCVVLERDDEEVLICHGNATNIDAIDFGVLQFKTACAATPGGACTACGQPERFHGFGSENRVTTGIENEGEGSLSVEHRIENDVAIDFNRDGGFSSADCCVVRNLRFSESVFRNFDVCMAG